MLSIRILAANQAGNVANSDESKCVKPETEKSKSQKLAKSRKLSKSKSEKSKKPSKSKNSSNFNATEAGPSLLTPNARTAFNRLWLAFIKALILCYFDPDCHIWIKTNISGYAISEMLSQLTSKTSLDGVVTKVNLG